MTPKVAQRAVKREGRERFRAESYRGGHLWRGWGRLREAGLRVFGAVIREAGFVSGGGEPRLHANNSYTKKPSAKEVARKNKICLAADTFKLERPPACRTGTPHPLAARHCLRDLRHCKSLALRVLVLWGFEIVHAFLAHAWNSGVWRGSTARQAATSGLA